MCGEGGVEVCLPVDKLLNNRDTIKAVTCITSYAQRQNINEVSHQRPHLKLAKVMHTQGEHAQSRD